MSKFEREEIAIEKACKENGLDSHITRFYKKAELATWADRLYSRWFVKDNPIKRSYMYCSTLDMNFFFSKDGKAMCTYAGYCDSDKEFDNLVKAFNLAKKVVADMDKFMKEVEEWKQIEC